MRCSPIVAMLTRLRCNCAHARSPVIDALRRAKHLDPKADHEVLPEHGISEGLPSAMEEIVTRENRR